MFSSIDGEINDYYQGRPSFFIRLQGCNLSCFYCDTKEAQSEIGGQYLNIGTILEKIYESKLTKITITGGEPLLQKNVIRLIEALPEYDISIETNGTIANTDLLNIKGLSIIADVKLPSTGIKDSINKEWIKQVNRNGGWIKFVIAYWNDFDAAVKCINSLNLYRNKVAISPCFPLQYPLEHLLDEMLKANLQDAVLNIQIHKLVNLK